MNYSGNEENVIKLLANAMSCSFFCFLSSELLVQIMVAIIATVSLAINIIDFGVIFKQQNVNLDQLLTFFTCVSFFKISSFRMFLGGFCNKIIADSFNRGAVVEIMIVAMTKLIAGST